MSHFSEIVFKIFIPEIMMGAIYIMVFIKLCLMVFVRRLIIMTVILFIFFDEYKVVFSFFV